MEIQRYREAYIFPLHPRLSFPSQLTFAAYFLNPKFLGSGMTRDHIPFSVCSVRSRLCLCRGKKNYDKRETLAKRDAQRDMERAAKNR